jgi:uncharacterized C2H2 Zn-finger protein
MRIRLEWDDYDEEWFQDMKAQKDYIASVEKTRAEYLSKWPNHCKLCKGWGYTSWSEYGQHFMEECECVWLACPRCGNASPTAKLDHKDEVKLIICKCGFLLHFTDGLQGY